MKAWAARRHGFGKPKEQIEVQTSASYSAPSVGILQAIARLQLEGEKLGLDVAVFERVVAAPRSAAPAASETEQPEAALPEPEGEQS